MATMTPSTCLLIILTTATLSTTMLFCSTPPSPVDASDDVDIVLPVEAAPAPDEGIWDAGNYEGGIAGPPCSGPAGGCGNAWCWPACGVPGQPGGVGAGGNTQQ